MLTPQQIKEIEEVIFQADMSEGETKLVTKQIITTINNILAEYREKMLAEALEKVANITDVDKLHKDVVYREEYKLSDLT